MDRNTNKYKWRFSTQAVHGGHIPDATGACVPPIYQTSAYEFRNADHASKLFDLQEPGNIYSRITNPTVAAFEKKISLLEGGTGALATSSGHAAVVLALLNICNAGDHIVSANSLYGGTYNLFSVTLKKFGIEVSFVDPDDDYQAIKKAFRPNTKVLFGETIGNPGLNILDFSKFAAVARESGVPLIIDNTFATPYLCRPFELGANVIIHSATKYLGGHGNTIAGVIVDGGNFDWENGKFPGLVQPDPSYHGMQYTKKFPGKEFIVKARVQLLRDLGSCLSPMNAFLLNLGLETLPLRMEKHSQNALKLAQYLEGHEKVSWVMYPGLKTHATYESARKYLPHGSSGMLAFGIKGGLEEGKKFIDSVKLARLVANLGDTRTLVIHPASTTHSQLTQEQQMSSGVTPDLIRVSVGIEDIEDIMEDFDRAMAQC